jgi:hypothetical protein
MKCPGKNSVKLNALARNQQKTAAMLILITGKNRTKLTLPIPSIWKIWRDALPFGVFVPSLLPVFMNKVDMLIEGDRDSC